MKEIRLAISKEIMELVDYVFGEEFQFDEFAYYVDNLMDIADFARRNEFIDVATCNGYHEVLEMISDEVFNEYKDGNLVDHYEFIEDGDYLVHRKVGA